MNERRLELEGEIERMKQRLSYNIKRYRKLSRVSQQALADMCGLHRTYISDLENAKCNPTLSVMMVLADCLNVQLEEFTERVIKCKSAIYFCWNIA